MSSPNEYFEQQDKLDKAMSKYPMVTITCKECKGELIKNRGDYRAKLAQGQKEFSHKVCYNKKHSPLGKQTLANRYTRGCGDG